MKTITVGDVFEVLHIRSFSSFCMESGARNSFVKIRARESLVSFEELGPLFLFSNKTIFLYGLSVRKVRARYAGELEEP